MKVVGMTMMMMTLMTVGDDDDDSVQWTLFIQTFAPWSAK